MNKIKFLKSKGLNHGDEVTFRVENQDVWTWPTWGTLNMMKDEPFIETRRGNVSINNGYDAYINSIECL